MTGYARWLYCGADSAAPACAQTKKTPDAATRKTRAALFSRLMRGGGG